MTRRKTQQRKEKTRRGRAWERTGFGGKTAWDWMELLIVPLVLEVGALLRGPPKLDRQ